ncbi:MAG: flavin reductase [Phycisphaerales bacterium]|nr:MAG: flavin reductase [Phycisphaerales bacterium]
MSTLEDSDLISAFDQIPCGLFLLTSAHEGLRSGVLARWVQQCSLNPPLVMVALPKGSPVEPLIRDSHSFALCQISDGDRFLTRKFSIMPDRSEDPFDTLSTFPAPSGSPVVRRAMSYLDCEVVRHVELESDCRLYVGEVRDGRQLSDGKPVIHLGGNGRIDELLVQEAEQTSEQDHADPGTDTEGKAGDSAA